MAFSVVLIEDDEALAQATKTVLQQHGARVVWFSDPPVAQDLLLYSPDLLILDCILGTTSGPDYLEQVRKLPAMANVAVILTTGHHELIPQLRTLEGPHLALIKKPFTTSGLLATTQQLLPQHAM